MLPRLLLVTALCACRPDDGREPVEPPPAPRPTDEAPFEPDDREVSEALGVLLDPEFDTERLEAVWIERNGDALWVCDIHPDTGALMPRDCRGTQVDVNTNPMSQGHGPEWVTTRDGSQILYTKWNGTNTLHLARAWHDGQAWQNELLAPDWSNAMGPLGSKDPGDRKPRLTYFDRSTGDARWRFLDGSADGPVADEVGASTDFRVPRWVPGTHQVIFARDTRVVLADLDSGEVEVLVDTPDTYHWFTFMWQSPSTGEWMFHAAGVDAADADADPVGFTRLEVFAERGGRWKVVKSIELPEGYPYVYSPEPTEIDGEVYISFAAMEDPERHPRFDTQIWLVAADPDDDFRRKVSGDGHLQRGDPEVVVLPGGPMVYYTGSIEASNGDFRHIIHRCATGL